MTGRVSAAGERRVEGGAERSEGPASKRSVALKVDCDTLEGTLEGVPRLLEIFGARGIRATFYFTLGPDRSGVAVRRVFTQRGFLAKMIRSRAPSLYGWKTMLYGTLLPAPMIGARAAEVLRAAARAGHDTGVHGWDHVGWHDRLRAMPREEIARAYGAAHAEFLRIFGVPARSSAAPGWAADARSLEVESERSLLHTSDTRGGAPFFPKAGERTLPTLEIPTTLPTLDETLAWPSLRGDAAQRAHYRGSVRGTEVHTVHTEIEGRSKAALFEGILDDWRADGVGFPTLAELAREALERRDRIPARPVAWTRLPGRAGEVATGWLEAAV
ncbi:MAG TPA: polysaccharide deacetylase family protein [Thermoanaerobaculia bacterium]|nr:polysaccharide deacetylase family protein [Thermoanaerobaculia bacterium]